MRNLSVLDIQSNRIVSIKNCEVFCYSDQVLYVYGDGIISKILQFKEEVICNLRERLYSSVEENKALKAVDIIYHYEKDLLYLSLCNGDIISINTNENGSETIVGSVNDGIKASQWSPGQDFLALVNGNENVMVLTNNFDPLLEVCLHDGSFGEKEIITVGWGRKETQFQGSIGKYKKEAVQEAVFEKTNTIRISWRGDGEYFAVSSINPEKNLRYIRIYDKNCILQSTSETINGLDDSIDWRSSGNLIASAQKLPNKYNVCFFEKNGMKHGEFPLPDAFNNFKVNHIFWSKDSKVLAVLLTKTLMNDSDQEDDLEGNHVIQLFTTSNYKWYWKYTIFTGKATSAVIKWDNEKYNDLHVILNKQNHIFYFKYTWFWTVNKSKVISTDDESLVTVVDGYKLLVTSFKRGIVPPPMSSYIIKFESPVNYVSFTNDDDEFTSNDLIVQLADGSVHFYKYNSSNDNAKINHKLFASINLKSTDTEVCYNCNWIGQKKLLFSFIKLNENVSKPFLGILNVEKIDSVLSYTRKEIPLHSAIAMLKTFKSLTVIYDNAGMLYSMINDNLTKISEIKGILDLEVREKDGNILIFSLNNSHKFHVNNKLVFSNILSFHVHEKFVLLTNLKHELLCFNFIESDILKSDNFEIHKRNVERGSRLVTSVYKDLKVILQLPRGNLECIQPRALSLYAVGKFLDSLNYVESFNLMRKQRINLNLIYDHNPTLFSKNVNVFIDQIKNPLLISLFISDIIDEDLTKTMYGSTYKLRSSEISNTQKNSKIEIVCSMMEDALTKIKDSEKYLLPILSCLIKRNKTECLEAALLKLKSLKERELKGDKPLISFDEAFRYILYLIDVDELYNIALGMYDFDLVLIIANKSQKDPKEYLPFLNNLKLMESHYQKYTIDKYLKRYDKALKSLIQCDGVDEINECLNFIKTHQLYKCALKMVAQNTDRYKSICLSYAKDLIKANLYEEAGIMYSNAGFYKNAIDAYRKSGNWHEVILCISKLTLSENELTELYQELASDLIEAKQFLQASTIYLDYLKNIEECLRTLVKGKLFAEAYRICLFHNCPRLIKVIIIPALLSHAHTMKVHITDLTETLEKQKNRLQVIRKNKAEESKSKSDFDIESDAYSDVSTIVTKSNASSHLTSKTYRSAKNKRKQERKLLSLKEGSPFEDLALLISLHNLVTTSINLTPYVKEINRYLLKINEYELAGKLQNQFKELLKKIENFKSEIWIPELLSIAQKPSPDPTLNNMSTLHITSENITSLFNLKYALPPETQSKMNWELDIL